jgi:hypothetical protein
MPFAALDSLTHPWPARPSQGPSASLIRLSCFLFGGPFLIFSRAVSFFGDYVRNYDGNYVGKSVSLQATDELMKSVSFGDLHASIFWMATPAAVAAGDPQQDKSAGQPGSLLHPSIPVGKVHFFLRFWESRLEARYP